VRVHFGSNVAPKGSKSINKTGISGTRLVPKEVGLVFFRRGDAQGGGTDKTKMFPLSEE
jgi:hypothetical protein